MQVSIVQADSLVAPCLDRSGEIRGRRRPTEVATTSRAEALPENPAGLLLPNTEQTGANTEPPSNDTRRD